MRRRTIQTPDRDLLQRLEDALAQTGSFFGSDEARAARSLFFEALDSMPKDEVRAATKRGRRRYERRQMRNLESLC